MPTYAASDTMTSFHKDNHFVRAIMGPIGSGKSVACCVELMLKATQQAPNDQGIRKTRFAIIRTTYRELIDTTMQTFFDWFNPDLGVMRKMDMKWTLMQDLPDGTSIHAEFLFRALDRPDDVKKLLSLELTGAWINEAREINKAIVDMLIGRLGRYPNIRDGGPTWHGLIMDTNPPDSDHWWYNLFEVVMPENHRIFKQSSGVSPTAENIENLPVGYYQNMQSGKDQEWINVYVHGRYGFVQDGKPVWPEYKDDVHSTLDTLEIPKTATIFVGIDFGLTPAAAFGYKTSAGRWIVFDELVTSNMGASTFARLLHEKINHSYRGYTLEIYGDPAGEQRAQTDETTPFQILAHNGINAWPTHTNDFTIRREAVASTLLRMDFAGNPGFLVGPGASMIRKALSGGYKYKRLQVTGHDKFHDKPDKGRYSHVADALQYMMLGAGEGDSVVGGYGKQDVDYSRTNRMVV
jgi:hypothetical protein